MIAALVIVPIVVGLGLFALPREREAIARWIGVTVAFLASIVAASLWNAPDESVRWLSRPFTAAFHVGIGAGPSYWIVVLAALTTGCALVASRVARGRDFTAAMLLLLGAMTGVFVARDLLLFALFWDLMLLPVFFVLGGWTSAAAAGVAWKYLVYNLAGGLVLLLATAAFGVIAGTTDVIGTGGVPLGATAALWIVGGFAFAFAIKTPLWPLHTWMPETYAELPPPMAAVVSAIQSKAGLYGFIVIGIPLFGDAMRTLAPLMMVLGSIALVYGALASLVQVDTKRVVAYSSLSHLGLIMLAIFSGSALALGGAVVYIVAHGLFSAGLFIVLGEVEWREGTRLLSRLGGLGARNPRLADGLLIVALAALGLPGLCGFAGEILILIGLYGAGFVWPAIVALVPIVVAAAYMLRLFQGVMHGPTSADVPERSDMSPLDMLAIAPLVIAIVLLGVNPRPVLESVPKSTELSATFGAVR